MSDLNNTIKSVKMRVKTAWDSKAVKSGLALLAIGVGAYYGTKAPFKQIASDVRKISTELEDINHELYNASLEVSMVGLGVQEWQEEERKFKKSQRDGIEEMIKKGKSFTHYPGVGVLDHSIYEDSKKSKR